MAFEIERATYMAHVEELRPDTGKWVLIRGSEIIGIYLTSEDAYESALEKCGERGFYIRQIETILYLETNRYANLKVA